MKLDYIINLMVTLFVANFFSVLYIFSNEYSADVILVEQIEILYIVSAENK